MPGFVRLNANPKQVQPIQQQQHSLSPSAVAWPDDNAANQANGFSGSNRSIAAAGGGSTSHPSATGSSSNMIPGNITSGNNSVVSIVPGSVSSIVPSEGNNTTSKKGKNLINKFLESLGTTFRNRRRDSIFNADEHIDVIRGFIIFRSLSVKDFDLGATVGTGTFGRVRMVKFKSNLKNNKGGPKIKCPFALKIMKKAEIIALRQVEHIRCEKEILSSLAHPFIVNLFGTFQDSKRLFMILEYVSGGEIFSLLRRKGRLHPEHSKFYVAEITLAFEYLHSFFIVYRDLKPENLLIDSHGHVKITDFGFAKRVQDLTWTLCGTPEYLAPEIIQSKGHGKAVDWWALGVLLFEFLAGYPPFYDEESAMGIYQKVIIGKFTAPKHMEVKSKDLIKHLLAVDRTKRLGCLANGVADVKEHKWFKNVNWSALYARQVEPPYVPDLESADDTSQFESYPESTESSANPILDDQQEHFVGF